LFDVATPESFNLERQDSFKLERSRSMAGKPEDHPVVAVFDYMGRIDNHVRANVTEHLPPGVTYAQYEVLRLLDTRRDGQTPAEIARALDSPKSALTNTLQRLEAAGYIRAEPCGEDGRKKRVWTTPAGREVYTRAVAGVRPRMDRLREAFTWDEFREVLPFLKALDAWFEDG
jgi:DNA-binding MarR family transcriptional regulator